MTYYIGVRWDYGQQRLLRHTSGLAAVACEPARLAHLVGDREYHVYRLSDSLHQAILAAAKPSTVRRHGPPPGSLLLSAYEQDLLAVSLAAGVQLTPESTQPL